MITLYTRFMTLIQQIWNLSFVIFSSECFNVIFSEEKKIFSGKILTKTLEKNPSMMYESLIILVG